MPVALRSKSGEFGDDSVNLMAPGGRSKYGWIPQISGWWIGAAAVCLGFLLLILILGVVAHNSSAIGHRESMCQNMIYSLTADKDTLRTERDQLKFTSSNLTKEIEALQSQYKAVAASRDKLQEEKNTVRDERDQLKSISSSLTQELEILKSQYNAMNASQAKLQEIDRSYPNRTRKECHQGWKSFGDKCYYFSASGVTKTWESSRKDCQERRADLAIVSTQEELDFISKTYRSTWIGLSDKDREGTWKWVDGTELVGDEFWQDGEPNNSDGNEDCAEVSRSGKRFNDVPCSRRFSWACEV